ncbi:MAG: cation transporter [Methylococcales bacterium]
MAGCGCEIEITDKEQEGILITLLLINAFMFILELGIGWYAQSTGLIADSLDMLADAIVYGIGLYVTT